MAINLKPVDVVVIGLGAAGGVAVLPLTRAGLKVAALEAGTWMQHEQFKPDEIHNNVRALVTTGTKACSEIPTFRTSPDQRARPAQSGMTMMNAVGGTSIHYYANSWRFHPWDFKARSRNDQALRPECDSPREHDGGLAAHLRRTRTVLRHRRV